MSEKSMRRGGRSPIVSSRHNGSGAGAVVSGAVAGSSPMPQSRGATRVYGRTQGDTNVTPSAVLPPEGSSPDTDMQSSPGGEFGDVIGGLFAWRKAERDMQQIIADPTRVPGYDSLPPEVQELAKNDPMVCMTLWQLAEQGIDFNAIVELQNEMDGALRGAGWDGVQAPTDEQFGLAEQTLKQKFKE